MGRKSLVSHPSFKTTRPKAGRIHVQWLTTLRLDWGAGVFDVLPGANWGQEYSFGDFARCTPQTTAHTLEETAAKQRQFLRGYLTDADPRFALFTVALVSDIPSPFTDCTVFVANDRAEFEVLLAQAVLHDMLSQAGLQ